LAATHSQSPAPGSSPLVQLHPSFSIPPPLPPPPLPRFGNHRRPSHATAPSFLGHFPLTTLETPIFYIVHLHPTTHGDRLGPSSHRSTIPTQPAKRPPAHDDDCRLFPLALDRPDPFRFLIPAPANFSPFPPRAVCPRINASIRPRLVVLPVDASRSPLRLSTLLLPEAAQHRPHGGSPLGAQRQICLSPAG
jgi:hypothetical protein